MTMDALLGPEVKEILLPTESLHFNIGINLRRFLTL